MAATVPIKAMGRSTLCVMSLSPEFGSIYTTYQNHSGVATPRKHQASDSTLWVVIPIKRHMLRMRSRPDACNVLLEGGVKTTLAK
jgi:hypothetical protein